LKEDEKTWLEDRPRIARIDADGKRENGFWDGFLWIAANERDDNE
jgi:hypothetical protein